MFADLCVMSAGTAVIMAAEALGWDAVCIAGRFKDSSSFRKFAEEAGKLRGGKTSVYLGALVSGNVAENAKKALELADLVLAEGRSEEACRQAAESYDVDMILGPEQYVENDMTDYRSSGLDHVTAKMMAEHGIAYGVRLSDILRSYGSKRIQLLGRISQNIRLAVKYKVRVVAVSGASGVYEMRAPRELASVLGFLGLGENSGKAVADNPTDLLRKAEKRRSQDVITNGLEVVSWGSQQKDGKRKHGWY